MNYREGTLTRQLNGVVRTVDLEPGPNGFSICKIDGEAVETEVPNLTLKLIKNMATKKSAKAKADGKGKSAAKGKAKAKEKAKAKKNAWPCDIWPLY